MKSHWDKHILQRISDEVLNQPRPWYWCAAVTAGWVYGENRDTRLKCKSGKKNVHSRCIATLYLKNVSFNVFFLGFDFPSICFQPWVLLAEVLGWTSAAGTLPVMVWGNGAFNILNCDPRKGQMNPRLGGNGHRWVGSQPSPPNSGSTPSCDKHGPKNPNKWEQSLVWLA